MEEENSPELIGYDQFKKVSVFNEKYIEDYVYQQNELIKNSFEIFVKSPDYDTHIKEIEKLLESINITFQNHPELEELIKVFPTIHRWIWKGKEWIFCSWCHRKGNWKR